MMAKKTAKPKPLNVSMTWDAKDRLARLRKLTGLVSDAAVVREALKFYEADLRELKRKLAGK